MSQKTNKCMKFSMHLDCDYLSFSFKIGQIPIYDLPKLSTISNVINHFNGNTTDWIAYIKSLVD